MAIDVDTVVRTSVAIADAEGLDALTMRRLATELAVTPMAIYHHVPGKEALLDLIADESMKQLPQPDANGAWDEELLRFFVAFHRLYLEHPALAQVMAQRPLEGPTAMARGELLLELLVRAGVSDEDAVGALVSLVGYTIGMSLYR
ncbi:MAG TPA: TetR/AcrR family transcriptional regulator, partial [Nocardioidaceae bacterium]|nr:TetR/AcrR family transcriptional regulator [Nocardioidaceae bacterium]